MADIQILFSQPMVRAIMREIEQPGTGNTQSRRVFKGIERQPNGNWHVYGYGGGIVNVGEDDVPSVAVDFAPYHVGDRLYVREAWRAEARWDDVKPSKIKPGSPVYYAADPDPRDNEPGCAGRLRPGMYMPRWASRLTLIVTDVRVQRLQDISADDVKAEGVEWGDRGGAGDYRHQFASLWFALNAKRGYGWDTNPWVVAVTFDPVRRNIDQPESA